jgi:DtxR family Mn-dependent transcriptional regulator
MFLITVARAIEDGQPSPVPVPLVADSLSISRVSANEMTKKLVGRGFVQYEPYRGVTLTASGTAVANQVLRRRRLWALFLAEHLGLSPTAADAVACEFEHITPAEVAGRLAGFLGDPALDPEGRPIPAAGTSVPSAPHESPLADVGVGRRCTVTRIAGDSATRSFLEDEGITEGTVITLLATGSDHGCLVEASNRHIHMSAEVASHVLVTSIPNTA